MRKLSGLLYPFIAQNNINSLKLASLYFDDIYVITPITVIEDDRFSHYYNDLSGRLIDEYRDEFGFEYASEDFINLPHVQDTINLQKKAKTLIDEGVIHIVNPFDEMKNAGLESELKTIIEHRAEEARRSARDGYDNFVAKCVISPSKQSLLRAKGNAISSIMADSAILLSSKFDSIPIVGNEVDDFKLSMQAIKGRCDERKIKKFLYSLDDHEITRKLEGFEIMKKTVIDNVPFFERIDFADILELRNNCKDELSSFRQEILKIAIQIKTGKFDLEKKNEIFDLVSKDVNPIVSELKNKINISSSKWPQILLDKSTSLNTLAFFGITVLIGIPLHYGLLTTAGIIGIQTGLENYFNIKEIKAKNGLSFVLKLQIKINKF